MKIAYELVPSFGSSPLPCLHIFEMMFCTLVQAVTVLQVEKCVEVHAGARRHAEWCKHHGGTLNSEFTQVTWLCTLNLFGIYIFSHLEYIVFTQWNKNVNVTIPNNSRDKLFIPSLKSSWGSSHSFRKKCLEGFYTHYNDAGSSACVLLNAKSSIACSLK